MLTPSVQLAFLFLAFLCFFQVLYGQPIEPSAEEKTPNEANIPMPWEEPLAKVFPNNFYRRKEEFTEPRKYSIFSFFYLDKTPLDKLPEEKQKLSATIRAINDKLRTEASFDGYYFEIKIKGLGVQPDYFDSENDYTLDSHLKKWHRLVRKKYSNKDVHVAMLLTRRSFFKKNIEHLSDPRFNDARKLWIRSEHYKYWKQFPQLYNVSTQPKFFPSMVPETILFNVTKVTKQRSTRSSVGKKGEEKEEEKEEVQVGNIEMLKDFVFDIQDDQEETASFDPKQSKQEESHGYTLGIMKSYGVCEKNQGTGVITGHDDPEFVKEFQGVFVHEFFHGFGLHHDPFFLEDCVGYVMEDAINLAPKVKFSPCSKAAMDYVLPLFPCIYNQHSEEKKEEVQSKS